MKKFAELGGVTYSIGELIEMINDPEVIYHIVGVWLFRVDMVKEDIELCDLLIRELEKN